MNVLIITEEDVFYVYEFFKSFFSKTANAPYSVKAITVCAAFNKRSYADLARQMYGFYGPVNFLRVGAMYVFKRIFGCSVASLASRYGISSWQTASVNDAAYIERIKKEKIDIIVSIAAPQIFKKSLLESVPLGCINSHSALLPENRGMMPVFWAMFKGLPQTGVTIHYMDARLDSGDIIAVEKVQIQNESLHEMILKTKRISARMIDETLRNIMNGTVSRISMPSGGSSQTFPSPDSVKEFRRRGRRLF